MENNLNPKKNILLLVLDGLRQDRLSMNGHIRKTTPFIDSLAKKGTFYSNCWSASNMSLPAHISMMTGKHPYFHKASSNGSTYDGKYPFITEVLKDNGYKTYGVSTKNPYFTRETGFLRGFDEYVQVVKRKNQFSKKTGKPTFLVTCIKYILEPIKLYAPFLNRLLMAGAFRKLSDYYLNCDLGGQKIVDEMVKIIERGKINPQPFFLFANIADAHTPFFPLKRYRDWFGKVKISNNLLFGLMSTHEIESGRIRLSPHDIESLNILYDCGVRYTDDLVANLFKRLEKGKLLDDLTVLILSDHGEMLYEKEYLIGHGSSLYEGVVKVPLLCLGKDFAHGKIDSNPCSTVDVFSTMQNISKNDDDAGCLDYDLRNTSADRVIYGDHPEVFPLARFIKTFPEMLLKDYFVDERMVVKNGYKFIWRSNGRHLLFNLRDDPHENMNLFGVKSEVAQELYSELQIFYKKESCFFEVYYQNGCNLKDKTFIHPAGFFERVIDKAAIRVESAEAFDEAELLSFL